MAKLPAIKPREVIRFLERNEFILDHVSGTMSSIIYHRPSKRRAVVPKHNRDLPKGTLLSLLREAGFTREELMQNEERERIQPGWIKNYRDGSSYEIHAPFDVWDGHVDGERRWCAEFSQTISSR